MVGMGGLRWMGRALGLALLLALLALVLAPGFAAALDRGPDGEARASPLPLALVLFDPATWQAVRNSVAVAAVATFGSVAIGVGLGLTSFGRRSWARRGLAALAVGPLALGPVIAAPGLVMVVGGASGWDWLAARSIFGASCEDLARWAMVAWVEVGSGVPLVILATSASLARIDPAWADAARAVGASKKRIWRDLTWPILRADVARAAASVFVLTLLEPAGPSILGLRRTVAVQILESARRLDQPTRPAAFAALAGLIAVAAWLAIRRWGGLPIDREPSDPSWHPAHAAPKIGRRSDLGSTLALAAWAAATLGPGLFALGRAVGSARAESGGGWATLARGWCLDAEFQTWVRNGLGSAALAFGVDLMILSGLPTLGSRAARRWLLGPFEILPPLALGVAALATPWLIAAGADLGGPRLAPWLGPIAAELAPGRWPGWLLALALAGSALPMLARAADLAGARARPALTDAAIALGVTPRRARRAGDPRWLGLVPARAAFLAFALASTAVAPALILTPSPATRTLAAGAFGLVLDSRGGTIDPRAAGPLLAILGVRVIALGFASAGRSGPIGRWFRG